MKIFQITVALSHTHVDMFDAYTHGHVDAHTNVNIELTTNPAERFTV